MEAMIDTFTRPRRFLAWRQPGDPGEAGRVELQPPRNIHDPEPGHLRVAETVTIPAGATITMIEESIPDRLY